MPGEALDELKRWCRKRLGKRFRRTTRLVLPLGGRKTK